MSLKSTRMLAAAAAVAAVVAAYQLGRHGAPPAAVSDAPSVASAAAAARPDPLPDAVATSPDTVRFEPGSTQNTNIVVAPVRQVALPIALPVNGRVTYDESATARVASPVAGRVVAIRRDVGDAVRAGEPLVEVDAPEVATALAELRKAQADHARRHAALERTRTLLEGEVIARKDFESAQADAQQSAAELSRAEQRLASLRVSPRAGASSVVALRSPIAGVVTERQVNPGQQLGTDPAALMVVSDIARLWVMVDLPERDLGKVRVGQPVAVEVDAFAEQSFAGRVGRIGAVVDASTRRVPVRIELANPGGTLKPEMFARVSFLSRLEAQVARVPNSGIVDVGSNAFAFVESAPGTYKRLEVRALLRDRDVSYVDGLPADAKVVTQGALLLNGELATR